MELELEGSVLGLGWSGIVKRGLLTMQRLLLWHMREAPEAMVAEDGHELRLLGLLGNGTLSEVISREGRRDELGLHEELGRMGLEDLLRLGGKQLLLRSEVQDASRAFIVGVNWDPVFAIRWSSIDSGSGES